MTEFQHALLGIGNGRI